MGYDTICKKLLGIEMDHSFRPVSSRPASTSWSGSWLNIWFGDTPMQSGSTLYFGGEPVTEVVIPDGIKKIGDYTFEYCSTMTGVTIQFVTRCRFAAAIASRSGTTR